MSGGGPANTTSTSTSSPPSWAVPAYQQYLNNLEATYLPGGTWKDGTYTPPPGGSTAQSPYVDKTVAPLSYGQQSGINAINNMGAYNATSGAANQQVQDTLGGRYLDPNSNPALAAYANAGAQGLVNNYQQAIAPGITAQAVQSGGLGGSGQNQAEQYAKWGLGQNLGNYYAGVYEPAYQQERANQMNAVSQAPGAIQSGYIAPEMQIQAGGLSQAQQQNEMNTAQGNQERKNLWPYTGLSLFGSGLGTIQGGQSTLTSPNMQAGIK